VANAVIPPKIIRFLDERASVALAGTRDSQLVPSGHRVSGWQIATDGRTVTVFVGTMWTVGLLDALRSNGRIAVTFEEVGTHETYQLKGHYVSDRPVRPDEAAVAHRSRDRFVKGLTTLFPDQPVAAMLAASIPSPDLAIVIEVSEVFLQTPGPGAGTRIAPAPESEVAVR
jgi:hypothetical protein